MNNLAGFLKDKSSVASLNLDTVQISSLAYDKQTSTVYVGSQHGTIFMCNFLTDPDQKNVQNFAAHKSAVTTMRTIDQQTEPSRNGRTEFV